MKRSSSWRPHHRVLVTIGTLVLTTAVVVLGSGCGQSGGKVEAPTATPAGSVVTEPTSVAVEATSRPDQSEANVWKSTVDTTALPLGDGKVSTSPQVGFVDSCSTNFRAGGAQHSGDWIDANRGTWNLQAKIAVQGEVTWPSASFTETVSGNQRVLTTDDLPEDLFTGVFPIAPSDPAHQYDTNPNHIASQSLTYTLPLNPTMAEAPACTGLGPIGVLTDGVLLYNALDDGGRDAVAHETQDECNGHPDGHDRYHYHDVPSCMLAQATGNSVLVGYALDGYGIYVERDAQGDLPTNADLDACHGRTSVVMWNGQPTNIYHYDATLEYPYTIGCFRGTPVVRAGG